MWTINERFSELVAKILEVGNGLINDPTPKCANYTHELSFVSNTDKNLIISHQRKKNKMAKKKLLTF